MSPCSEESRELDKRADDTYDPSTLAQGAKREEKSVNMPEMENHAVHKRCLVSQLVPEQHSAHK